MIIKHKKDNWEIENIGNCKKKSGILYRQYQPIPEKTSKYRFKISIRNIGIFVPVSIPVFFQLKNLQN